MGGCAKEYGGGRAEVVAERKRCDIDGGRRARDGAYKICAQSREERVGWKSAGGHLEA